MPCYKPIIAYRSRFKNTNGKRNIVFKVCEAMDDSEIKLPCGKCIGCRLERSRQWAVRCMHEASMYDENAFLTLTYDEDHLPFDYSLDKSHLQKFMKRLRKRIEGRKVRYFACGEYGDENLRPHYHLLLFNYNFPDRLLLRKSENGNLYSSQILTDIWNKGMTSIGEVTFESSAYVARYCTKKVDGDQEADGHYKRVCAITGEEREVEKEFMVCSRRPGIGRPWFDKYGKEVFPSDSVIVNGKEAKPPRYYEKIAEGTEGLEIVKEKRYIASREMLGEETDSRLKSKEKVKKAQFNQLKRKL